MLNLVLYFIFVFIVSFGIPQLEPWTYFYNCIKSAKLRAMNEILINGNLKELVLSKFRKKEKIGHIGILQTDIKKVKDIPRNTVKKDFIYLLDSKDADYETRKPLEKKICLEEIVRNVIQRHYEQLQEKLRRNGWIEDPLFSIEYNGKLQPVCNVMKEIYNVDTLWEAIEIVKGNIGTDGAIKCIGNKINSSLIL